MNERDKLWRQYQAEVRVINVKADGARTRAANRYSRAMAKLDKADKAATVGKPPRSKGHGTRSRS